jgi:threonine dehydrogenase-like Zn-dependent dehydrogenase
VLAAKRLGTERIILMGRHKDRTDLGREFGTIDVVPERGDEGVARVRELTGGDSTHAVLECVGLKPAIQAAFGVVRDGGVVSRVDAPQYPEVPAGFGVFMRNITLTGGVAPARAYIEQLLPDVLDGRVEPGRVLDRTISLDEVPDGYRAMAARAALKVLIRP